MSSTSRINFFIVGAAKGGTTTAFERLNNRDDVYLSPLKEPNFYSTDIDIEKFSTEFKANTRLDLSDYFENDPLEVRQIGFVRSESDYDQLFKPAPESAKVIGECSTSYLWSTEAPEKIAKAHPDAKILIMLRDPISRLVLYILRLFISRQSQPVDKFKPLMWISQIRGEHDFDLVFREGSFIA